MKFLTYAASLALLLSLSACGSKQPHSGMHLNDLGYFEERGVNVLVYNNNFNGGFNDEKNSGIEVIHHGVRTIQGGAIRLNNTPEQWDLVPLTTSRTVDSLNQCIEVGLRYEDYNFDARLEVRSEGDAVQISVCLDQPVPAELEGKAGFNLEFLPSQYWHKTYLMDGRPNRFPRYAVSETVARPNSEKPRQYKGYKTYDDRGTDQFVDPLPMARGRELLVAPEAPERMVTITSDSADLLLFDGRMLAQNGWFVLRSLLPAGRTGRLFTWTVRPNSVPNWVREPNIGFSQVGYMPQQPKVAVIELDRNDKPLTQASLMQVMPDGTERQAYSGKVTVWGEYFKYNYAKFDFTSVQQPGIYYIKYGEHKTNNFIVAPNVYDKITDATSDVWIPIHMNHMAVNEGYRMWHGEPFKEGYLQAPVNTDHFDLHWQGPTTDTKYKPLQLIPGLNVGGFFDAGDFDIETGSNISVVQNLVSIWELFRPERDETFVSQRQRYVDLHRPDGTPDVLQYIEHGTLNLVAQAEQIGHMAQCLSNSVLDNYHHLGDAGSLTDGLHYNPALKPYESRGNESGTPDDLWAFTSRNPMLDFRAATVFAAASRALQGYNDDLAQRALRQSKRLLDEATELMKQPDAKRRLSGEHDSLALRGMGDIPANLQLYAATHEQQYLEKFSSRIWDALEVDVPSAIKVAIDAIPYMDDAYRKRLVPYVEKYAEYVSGLAQDNPYAVPITRGNWAGSGAVSNFGTTVLLANRYFPDLIKDEWIFRAADYLFGCHPYHNYSLAAVVGAARPKEVFYGNNRADFAAIPGNVAPGMLFRHPDHFENYDDWPFLWGQNEGTIAGNTSFFIFGATLKEVIAK